MSETIFRVAIAIIFLTAFVISGYFRSKADRDSDEKIPRKVDGKALMYVIRIGGLLLWLTPFAYVAHPQWLAWSKIGLPIYARWAGIGLGLICLPLFYWLFSSIGSGISPTSATRQQHQLVTRGPYRWVRHPLYTIGTILFLAFGLIADSWFLMLLGLIVFIIMAIRTPKEEANLIEKFGKEYEDYMKRTGRFLPRLRKK